MPSALGKEYPLYTFRLEQAMGVARQTAGGMTVSEYERPTQEKIYCKQIVERGLYVLPLEAVSFDIHTAKRAILAGELFPIIDYKTMHDEARLFIPDHWYDDGKTTYLAMLALRQVNILERNAQLQFVRQNSFLGSILNYFEVGMISPMQFFKVQIPGQRGKLKRG